MIVATNRYVLVFLTVSYKATPPQNHLNKQLGLSQQRD